MLTRCPACATHFRITPAQLKARAGSVRCGACQHVFNALDSLVEESVVVAAPAIPEPAQQALGAAMPDEIAVSPASTPELAEEAPQDIATLTPEVREPSIPELAETVRPDADTDADKDVEESLAEDRAGILPEPPPPPRRWPWVIGSLVALAALGLQAALAFRTELAVVWPQTRPTLAALCEPAGCEVGLPAKVALVGIEASDLHPDSERKGRLILTATLKNRAPFAQTFPHLELTLTDTEDKAVARKVLAPADYLPPGTPLPQGMHPGADIAVVVGIDSGELPASGYRLYLFYP